MEKQLTTAEKLKQAATTIVGHLKQVVTESDAEKLVEDVVQAVADGIVEGIELVSPPLLVAGEKLVLPWAEKKAVAAADGLIEQVFAKLGAKATASSIAATDASPAAKLNAL